jgi:hypothetical protein
VSSKVKLIPLAAKAEWKSALHGIPTAFAHSWENCYAMHLTTGFETFLFCLDTPLGRVICPLAERSWHTYIDIVTPYGFSGFVGNADINELHKSWQQFTRDQGYICGYLALNPCLAETWDFPGDEVFSTNSLYILDLKPSLETILAALDRNRRRQLKHWQTLQASLVTDKKALTEFLIAHYQDFLLRVGASPANHFSDQTLRELCASENVRMIGAAEQGRLVAMHAFSYTPALGDCLFNVALDEGRDYTTALLWWGINDLKSLGVPLLNMGGGVHEDDPVARAKQRFGAVRKPFSVLKQVYRPDVYENLCAQHDIDASDRTGYFPAYRKSSLSSSRVVADLDHAAA